MPENNYNLLKLLVGSATPHRFSIIANNLRGMGLDPKIYSLDSPTSRDNHIVVPFNYHQSKEIWLTANYDTFGNLPSGNNNSSSVVAFLSLAERLKQAALPVNLRMIFFDRGLDPTLADTGRRNPQFVPGSGVFLRHMIDKEMEFIDSYSGAITVQAVGKGDLQLFTRTGKRYENSSTLNNAIQAFAKSQGFVIPVADNSPHADNISLIQEGLDATVLARFDEKSWRKMQTKEDDLTNVNINLVNDTANFLYGLVSNWSSS